MVDYIVRCTICVQSLLVGVDVGIYMGYTALLVLDEVLNIIHEFTYQNATVF